MTKLSTKKFLTAFLAVSMLSSMAVPAFATETAVEGDYHTEVTYKGTSEGNEYFLLTVPATMAPGSTDDVTLKGAWPAYKTYNVTADKTVEMKGSLGNDKTLDITFPGISLSGSNTEAVQETKQVSVESMTALFGKYEGTFNYNLTISGDTADDNGGGGAVVDPTPETSGLDKEHAVDFEITFSNREAIGYTGSPTKELIIPEYFIGDGNNGTEAGVTYKVTSIGDGALQNGINLISVIIPNSVTSIGKNAFINCGDLSSIKLPDNLTSIGSGAFYACGKLNSIIIPNSLTSIGSGAFSGSGLTSITIPNGVTSICDSAFYCCTGLNTIIIPDSVASIDVYAFYACSNLTSITYTGTKEQWKSISKVRNWDGDTGNYTIHCTDGDIAKS